MPLETIREILRHRGKTERKGWWANQTWTIAEARRALGLTPDRWAEESIHSRYQMIAEHRAQSTKAAWESLSSKERTRAVWEWREAKRIKNGRKAGTDRR